MVFQVPTLDNQLCYLRRAECQVKKRKRKKQEIREKINKRRHGESLQVVE